jgi:cyanophycin synthetase
MNVSNALQAACAGIALGVPPSAVERALKTFRPSFEAAPGRVNRLTVGRAEVLIDYAHNLEALRALATMVERLRDGRRTIGVVSIPGDRRPEDHVAFGALAGSMFDELFVAEPNLRGRLNGEVAAKVIDAARDPSPADTGGASRRAQRFEFIADEVDASVSALHSARPGDLVVLCVAHAEPVYAAIKGFDMAARAAFESPLQRAPVGIPVGRDSDREPPATSDRASLRPAKADRPDDRLGPAPSVTPASNRSTPPSTPDGAVSRS